MWPPSQLLSLRSAGAEGRLKRSVDIEGKGGRLYEETLRDEVEWLVQTGKVKAAAQAQGKHAAAHA